MLVAFSKYPGSIRHSSFEVMIASLLFWAFAEPTKSKLMIKNELNKRECIQIIFS